MAFVGPIPEGYDVHHIDLDKTHNWPINFQLMTHSDHLHLHRLLEQPRSATNPW